MRHKNQMIDMSSDIGLKRLRYSAAYSTGAERCLIVLVAFVAMFGWLSGCVQFDVSSAADCDENSKTDFDT